MEQAQQILELMSPFISYLSPLLILLVVVATGDHITLFVENLIRNKKMRF
jgi:uncharacterized membrane protein (DUF106 family)